MGNLARRNIMSTAGQSTGGSDEWYMANYKRHTTAQTARSNDRLGWLTEAINVTKGTSEWLPRKGPTRYHDHDISKQEYDELMFRYNKRAIAHRGAGRSDMG